MGIITDTDFYSYISWEATAYALSCARIIQGREISRDRKNLVELGDKIVKSLRRGWEPNDYKNYEDCFINSSQGLLLAIGVEEKWLTANNYRGSCAEGLRELGVDSLESLAEVLSKAESREEFDKYAPHLKELFKGWHDWAEECGALRQLPYPQGPEDIIWKIVHRQSA